MNSNQTNCGLPIHDKTGKALVWFHGCRNGTFAIYKETDDAIRLGTSDLADITQYDHDRRAFRCKANNQDGRGEVA